MVYIRNSRTPLTVDSMLVQQLQVFYSVEHNTNRSVNVHVNIILGNADENGTEITPVKSISSKNIVATKCNRVFMVIVTWVAR